MNEANLKYNLKIGSFLKLFAGFLFVGAAYIWLSVSWFVALFMIAGAAAYFHGAKNDWANYRRSQKSAKYSYTRWERRNP